MEAAKLYIDNIKYKREMMMKMMIVDCECWFENILDNGKERSEWREKSYTSLIYHVENKANNFILFAFDVLFTLNERLLTSARFIGLLFFSFK